MKSNLSEPVSVVVTSCGRFNLLSTTLESFIKYNTYPYIKEIIIIDDSGIPDAHSTINKIIEQVGTQFNFIVICNQVNIGQVASIDLAYKSVSSDYIFHLEDDWEFYAPNFIEKSFAILDNYPWVITVWLRAHSDTNGHPIEFFTPLEFGLLTLGYSGIWHGFTWNPGLRRLSDYKKIGSFLANGHGEASAGAFYMRHGYRACITDNSDGFVRHIGWEQSTALNPEYRKG